MFFQEEKRIAFVFSYIWSILDEKIVSDSSDVTVVARVILAVCRDDSSLFNFFGGRQCAWNFIRVSNIRKFNCWKNVLLDDQW